MTTSSWRNYYELNQLNRPEPAWDVPCALPDRVRRLLAVSLSHFQLGETGGGTFLLKQAVKEGADTDDLAALTYFVREEGEHARLLAGMVKHLGGTLVERHWSHRLFKLARRAGGFRFEIQMLLTAEIVGTVYYEMTKAGTENPVLNSAIGLMLRDEARHVAFHLDRLSVRWATYLPFERALWSLQFQVLILAAMRFAWLDHGTCLQTLGYSWQNFAERTRKLTIQFLDGLERRASQCGTCGSVKATAETAPV